MVDVTKAQFVNDINSFLQAQSNAAKNATGTDVTRSGGDITTSNFAAVTTAALPSGEVRGPEVQSMLETFTQQFSRVRKANFWLDRSPDPNTFSYSRFARITTGAVPSVDNTYTDPAASTFNNVQPLVTISLNNYHNILTTLQGTLNTHKNKLYKTYVYCHSSCHSNCHLSRGRR